MKLHSLSHKALLAIFVILLPILIVFVIGYVKNIEYLKDQSLKNLTIIAESYEGQVLQFLDRLEHESADLAGDPEVIEALSSPGGAGALDSELKNLARDNVIDAVVVASKDGVVTGSGLEELAGRDLSREEFLTRGLEGPATVIFEDYPVGGSALAVSTPVEAGGETLGVVAVLSRIENLTRVLDGSYAKELGALTSGTGKLKTMESYIINRDRVMIAGSALSDAPVRGKRVATMPVETCLGSTSEVTDYYAGYQGTEVAGASMCIPSLGWTLLVEVDSKEMLASSNEMLTDAVTAAVVVAGLIGLLFLAYLRTVAHPLAKISTAVEGVARGEYDTTVEVGSRDEIGSLAGAFNAMASEIKARTTALKKSEERLKEAQRIARLGNWEWDIPGGGLYWSDEIHSIFGTDPEGGGPTYERFIELIHPEDREDVKHSVNEALYENREYSIDHRIIRPDGGVAIVHEQGRVYYGDNGEPVRMVGTVQDITERKAAELARKKSEERYASLFENSKDIIFISTPEGRLLDINPAGVEAFGFSTKEEMIEAITAEEMHMRREDRARFKEEIEEKGYIKDFETVFRKHGDGELNMMISAAAVRNDSGEIEAYQGIMHDMTERKKLEEQLVQSQKMEAIGQLTGGIAHDFNNIITAITGYGTILGMKLPEGDPLRENVEHILTSSERAAELTQGLLAFSRKQVVNLRPVDLNEVIKGAETLLGRLIGEDIEFRTTLAPRSLTVMADSSQLEQVILNLVTNARDAMPGGGDLEVSTKQVHVESEIADTQGVVPRGDYALISVTDTGTGMDQATREKVFEPFFSTKEVGQGTGLGLSIIYGLVKQHDGHISVYSEPGKGSTFKVYLPLCDYRAASVEKDTAEETVPAGTETILLAEDDPEVRELARTFLEESGYTVIAASDGMEAVEKFKENGRGIDLVVLDVIMPKMNGREAYLEISRARPGVKAVFMSGYTRDVISRKGILDEGLEFVSKPLSPMELAKRIRETLDK